MTYFRIFQIPLTLSINQTHIFKAVLNIYILDKQFDTCCYKNEVKNKKKMKENHSVSVERRCWFKAEFRPILFYYTW